MNSSNYIVKEMNYPMEIKAGQYYTLESNEEDRHERYTMLVLPKPDFLPEQLHRTETLGIHNMTMWQNDWLEEYFHRTATPDEIEMFKSERSNYGKHLQGIGELVSGGFKIDKIEELHKMVEYLQGGSRCRSRSWK